MQFLVLFSKKQTSKHKRFWFTFEANVIFNVLQKNLFLPFNKHI